MINITPVEFISTTESSVQARHFRSVEYKGVHDQGLVNVPSIQTLKQQISFLDSQLKHLIPLAGNRSLLQSEHKNQRIALLELHRKGVPAEKQLQEWRFNVIEARKRIQKHPDRTIST